MLQKIVSGKSFEEIRQIVEKVGTNHTISNKKVAWNWQPPYDFLASFLASPASWRGEPKEFSRAKNLTFPVWWARLDLNQHPFLYKRNAPPLSYVPLL